MLDDNEFAVLYLKQAKPGKKCLKNQIKYRRLNRLKSPAHILLAAAPLQNRLTRLLLC